MKNRNKIINLYLLLFSFIAFAQVKIDEPIVDTKPSCGQSDYYWH